MQGSLRRNISKKLFVSVNSIFLEKDRVINSGFVFFIHDEIETVLILDSLPYSFLLFSDKCQNTGWTSAII